MNTFGVGEGSEVFKAAARRLRRGVGDLFLLGTVNINRLPRPTQFQDKMVAANVANNRLTSFINEHPKYKCVMALFEGFLHDGDVMSFVEFLELLLPVAKACLDPHVIIGNIAAAFCIRARATIKMARLNGTHQGEAVLAAFVECFPNIERATAQSIAGGAPYFEGEQNEVVEVFDNEANGEALALTDREEDADMDIPDMRNLRINDADTKMELD